MLFSAFRYGFSLEEARCLYLAWTQSRGRKISKAEFQQWDKDVLQWVWQSAQPYIQKYEKEQERERQRQKELRKERRQERHQHKLRTLVLNALAAHPSTIAVIAKELNESYRAVENHMLRHLKAGKVKRIGRGLYASASFDSTVVQMTASDSVQTTLNGVHDVFRKDNDDDFFEKCFTPRKRDTTGENTCYATPSSGQSRSTRYSAKELGNEPLDEYRDTASPGTLCLMDTRTGLLMLSGELQEGTVERTLLIFRRLNLSVQEISSLARPVSDTHKSEPRP
jgi:hypothetical protein